MKIARRTALLAAAALLAACASPGQEAAAPAPREEETWSGPLVRGMAWVGITVSDLDRTTAFYQQTTPLKVVDETPIRRNAALDAVAGRKGVSVETRMLRGSNAQLRLLDFSSSSPSAKSAGWVPVQGPGITHVCHQSPDSKPIFPKFVAAGAKPMSRTGDLIQLRPDVPVKYAYLHDADGVMIEIEQLMVPNLPYDYRMRHVALAVTDIERTVTFYTAFLGKPPRERRFNLVNKTLDDTTNIDNLKLNVAWYPVSDFELEIWQYLNPAPQPLAAPRPVDAPGYSMVVYDVANLEAAMRRVTEAGGTLVSQPAPMDGGRIAFARDTEGNLLGLQQVPETSPASYKHTYTPKT